MDEFRLTAVPDAASSNEDRAEPSAHDGTDEATRRGNAVAQRAGLPGNVAAHPASRRSVPPLANSADPSQIKPLADQLMQIALQLRASTDDALGAVDEEARAEDGEGKRSRHAELARRAYALRRRRAAIFGHDELFGEPAWDILLDLYIAEADGKPVSVSSACIGSAAPPTTGLRWLGVLAEHDLVLREHDPVDQRRVLVRLTQRGIEAMDRFFALAAEPERG